MTITPQGLEIKSLETIRAEMVEDIRGEIDPALNLSDDDPMGQVVAVIASGIRELWEALLDLDSNQDTDESEGVYLDEQSALTGTIREGATFSSVFAAWTITTPFSKAAQEVQVHVVGHPDRIFTNLEAVGPIPSGGATTVFMVAVESGEVIAPAGTLTEIIGSPTGLTAVNNVVDAGIGLPTEIDPELRARRESELQAQGSTNVDAIRSDVSDVAKVVKCDVFENVNDTPNADGMPGHSIEVVILDAIGDEADDDQIAQAIWDSKAGGIESFGRNATGIAVDTLGESHTVPFTRAPLIEVWIEATIRSNSGYSEDDAVEELLARGREKLIPEKPMYRNDFIGVLQLMDTIDNVETFEIGLTEIGVAASDLPAVLRSAYILDASRINLSTV